MIGKFDLRGSTKRLRWAERTDKLGKVIRFAVGVEYIEKEKPEELPLPSFDEVYGKPEKFWNVSIPEVDKESEVQEEQEEQRSGSGDPGRANKDGTDRMRILHGVQEKKGERMEDQANGRIKTPGESGVHNTDFFGKQFTLFE